MNTSWPCRLLTAGTTLLAAGSFLLARAQPYPNKPIRIIVPVASGDTTDTLARAIAEKLAVRLRQQVLVENRPGAGGSIAFESVARSAPDGYTLVLGDLIALGMDGFRRYPYDPTKDFTPISLVSQAPGVLLVQWSLPAKSVGDLIAIAKAKPDQITIGSPGLGSMAHIAGIQFLALSGTRMVQVPYKGGAGATAALLKGEVQVTFTSVPEALALVRQEKARALAVTSSARSPLARALPTVAESGLPGFNVVSAYGVFSSAGTRDRKSVV